MGTYDIVIGRSKKDKAEFGLDGTIYLGKHYVQMGQTTALSNKVYLDMVRSHVVFIAGKRGGGKCLTGDTKITLGNGDVKTIKELEESPEKILALGHDLKIEKQSWEGFYKRTVNTILKITLRTGKQIELTPEHPLLTVQGWKDAQQMMIGARIATPRIQPVFGDDSIPEHEIKLIAYLLAEGCMRHNFILFSNKDKKIVSDFTNSVKNYDSKLSVVEHSKPGCYRITGRTQETEIIDEKRDSLGRFTTKTKMNHKSAMRKWLESLDMYGRLANKRAMPDKIYRLPKHQLALFLNRLFSCDGSIGEKHHNYWEVSYSSASHEFIESVSHLLTRFGIISRTRKKYSKKFKTYSYEIIIGGEFVHTYLQEIGFFGKKEQRATRALRDCLRITRNPNTDTIPIEIWDSYKPENWAEVGRKIGYKHPKALRESTRYAPGRQKLLQIAIADEQEALQQLATSDIFWDEVVKIERKEGEYTVYDITVPELHNFVANDIIVHNSYTLGVIAEGMADMPDHIKNNMSIILLDTMGIYWTMKYPNQKERELVDKWGLEVKPMDINIFTPHGYYKKAKEEGIPTDHEFSILPSELLGSDWVTTFGLDPHSTAAVLIERIIHDLKETEKEFSLKDIMDAVQKSKDADKNTKLAVNNHFTAADNWGLFSEKGTPISELAKPGQVTVLDISAYSTQEHGWEIKSLVTGIVSQKLFLERMQARKEEEFKQVDRDVNFLASDEETQKFPLVWLVIDEAHEFLPNVGKTLATDPLVTILREGRQPGISLVLASQQPGKIHTDVMTQADTVISHRITAKIDTDALGMLMQSYLRKGLDSLLDSLPRVPGAALILDDTNEKMFPIQIRPRMTWHGGESPSALKKEKELFEF